MLVAMPLLGLLRPSRRGRRRQSIEGGWRLQRQAGIHLRTRLGCRSLQEQGGHRTGSTHTGYDSAIDTFDGGT